MRSQPSLVKVAGVYFRVVEVATRDIAATHQDVADPAFWQGDIIVAGDAQFAAGNRRSHADQCHGIAAAFGDQFGRVAHAHAVPVEQRGAEGPRHRRKARGQRGFGQTVDRIHGIALEPHRRHARHELFAELDGDRLRAVEDQPYGTKIKVSPASDLPAP